MATRKLEAGTCVSYDDSEFTVGHTVLEGHRFAVEPVAEGEDLLSWGLRFGCATRDIAPGDYACYESVSGSRLDAAKTRILKVPRIKAEDVFREGIAMLA